MAKSPRHLTSRPAQKGADRAEPAGAPAGWPARSHAAVVGWSGSQAHGWVPNPHERDSVSANAIRSSTTGEPSGAVRAMAA